MADDTRVTKSRCALACAVVLFWALGCALPAVSNAAELLVQRDAGLSAHERADLRADAGVTFERTSALPRTELVSVPDSDEQAALIKLTPTRTSPTRRPTSPSIPPGWPFRR